MEALFERRRAAFLDDILPATGRARGPRSPTGSPLTTEDRAWVEKVFAERIFPVLTPLAVDPGHPFPYISNLSLNLAVIVRDPVGGRAPLRPGEGAAGAARVAGACRTASASWPSSR